jgi:hypothetical protein
VLRDGVEVRVARVEGPADAPYGALRLGGWPVAPVAGETVEADAPAASARTDGLRTLVHGLAGFARTGVTRTTPAHSAWAPCPGWRPRGDAVPG